MAMSVTLTQTTPATFGTPTNYVATVSNSSGGNVNLNSMQPVVSLPNGQPYMGAVIGIPSPAGTVSIANTGGYQFNVVIPASGSVSFSFSIDFGGQAAAAGTLTEPDSAFIVSVGCFSSDGSVFSAQSAQTDVNLPTFGPSLSMGAPENQWPGSFPGIGSTAASPGAPGTLDFQNPFNATLAL